MVNVTEAPLFGQDDIIFQYTREQAIADGVLVSCMDGDLAEVSRQHYLGFHVAMTNEVFCLIEKAVTNKNWCNDYRGVWHDILWMSKRYQVRKISETIFLFQVIITGAGRKRNHTMKVVLSAE